MSNIVTISCMGASPVEVDPKRGFIYAVNEVINHWKTRLDDVLPDQPDIIVLPEICDRPKTTLYRPRDVHDYYIHRGNQVREHFARVASDNNCYVAYSAVSEGSDGQLRNSTQLIDRAGSVLGRYDKNHLTLNEAGNLGYAYGDSAPTFKADFGTIAMAICFDLNFEELLNQYVAAHPDMVLFSSAYHGGLMQSYWAYMTGAYFIGSVHQPAPSTILSPLGEVVGSSTNYNNYVTRTVNLDCVVLHLSPNRAKFGAIKKKYGPTVRIHDPGLLGSVLLTSEGPDTTAEHIVNEFDLELLDDYFVRVRAQRRSALDEPIRPELSERQ